MVVEVYLGMIGAVWHLTAIMLATRSRTTVFRFQRRSFTVSHIRQYPRSSPNNAFSKPEEKLSPLMEAFKDSETYSRLKDADLTLSLIHKLSEIMKQCGQYMNLMWLWSHSLRRYRSGHEQRRAFDPWNDDATCKLGSTLFHFYLITEINLNNCRFPKNHVGYFEWDERSWSGRKGQL